MKRDDFFHAFLLFTLNAAQAIDEVKATALQWKKNADARDRNSIQTA